MKATDARLHGAAMNEIDDGDASSLSMATRDFQEKLRWAARTRVPVFLLGPSGVGKTFTARQIHELSTLTGPFVPINCARLPHDAAALHSELLGHVRGAYTGAEAARVGKLQASAGGTLFLDEVESLPPLAQGFLLDVLEGSGDTAPLGAPPSGGARNDAAPRGARPFRLIAASKIPLAHSGLRADLCERLAEGHLWRVPGLAERRAEIPALVARFTAEQAVLLGVPLEFSADAVALCAETSWPGEVRQLRATVIALAQLAAARHPHHQDNSTIVPLVIAAPDVIRHLAERAMAFGRPAANAGHPGEVGSVLLSRAPTEFPQPHVVTPVRVKACARALTREQVLAAIASAGGSQAAAARALGVARNTIARKLKGHGLSHGGRLSH